MTDKLVDCIDCVFLSINRPISVVSGYVFRILGPCFVISFYYLMARHTWVYLHIICRVLRSRLGSTFATIWTLVGIVITMNVVWNHMLAMILKPGGPKDLKVSLYSFI